MTKLTKDQLDFLEHYNLPLSRVLDATGMPRSLYQRRMADGGYVVAMGVTPCKRGHSLRKKSGHCVQCSPANLGYEARYNDPGEVYVAHSAKNNLTKIGSTASSVQSRIDQINSDRYGGINDWRFHWSCKCDHAGRVESETHQALHSFRAEGRSYFKSGSEVLCNEIFSCSLTQAVSAVERAVAAKFISVKQRNQQTEISRNSQNALTIAKFASELGVLSAVLLEQLKAAGVSKHQTKDSLTETDKTQLLEYLRGIHGAKDEKGKISLPRRQTSEINKSDSTGRPRSIQVEVRKTRVIVRGDLAKKAEPAAFVPLAPAPVLAPVVDAVQHLRQEEARKQAELIARQVAELREKNLSQKAAVLAAGLSEA